MALLNTRTEMNVVKLEAPALNMFARSKFVILRELFIDV